MGTQADSSPRVGLTDLNLASVLASQGIPPDQIKSQPYSSLCAFRYKRTPDLDAALSEWQDGPPVEVHIARFMGERRKLLDEVRRTRQGGSK